MHVSAARIPMSSQRAMQLLVEQLTDDDAKNNKIKSFLI